VVHSSSVVHSSNAVLMCGAFSGSLLCLNPVWPQRCTFAEGASWFKDGVADMGVCEHRSGCGNGRRRAHLRMQQSRLPRRAV